MRLLPLQSLSFMLRLCSTAAAVTLLFHAQALSRISQAKCQTKTHTSAAANARPQKRLRPEKTPPGSIRARGVAADCARSPRLRGTLIQPWLLAGWSREQLRAELEYMRGACIDQLVVQWTADSKSRTTFYPTALPDYKPASDKDLLAALFAEANELKLDVYLGLQTNDDWEDKYGNDPDWLKGEARESVRLANDVWKRYEGSREFRARFKGWYLPFEFDNVHFRAPDQGGTGLAPLVEYYATVGEQLHILTADKPVVISPFYNVSGDPTPNSPRPSEWLQDKAGEWRHILGYILARSPIDIVALQDGVGAQEKIEQSSHATVAQLPTMFAATAGAIRDSGKKIELWANTETYVQNRPGLVGNQPMFVRDIVAGMRAVNPYVTNVISFSFNHYMSPQQGHGAFYRSYRSYLASGEVEKAAPMSPPALRAEPMDAVTIALNWDAPARGDDVAGYNLFRDGVLVRRLDTDAAPGAAFTDLQLSPETAFSYQVSSFDAAGNESGKTPARVVTPRSLFNVALERPYTASTPADSAHPDEGCHAETGTIICQKPKAELTDAVPEPGEAVDYSKWQGRNTDSPYSFTIDLGEPQLVEEVSSDWLQVPKDGVRLPKEIIYYLSTDSVHFEEVGRVGKPRVPEVQMVWRYRAAVTPKSGRYIRIVVTPGGGWSLVGEAQVMTQ